MTHVFPATWEDHSTKAGYERIIFEVDDANREMILSINNSTKGKQFLIVAYEIGDDADAIMDVHSKPDEQRTMLMKRLYAIIADTARVAGLSETAIKSILKAHLKGKKLLTSSLSELDEVGLANACHAMSVTLHPDRFDYDSYKKDPAYHKHA